MEAPETGIIVEEADISVREPVRRPLYLKALKSTL
jgi:hypothetical protein